MLLFPVTSDVCYKASSCSFYRSGILCSKGCADEDSQFDQIFLSVGVDILYIFFRHLHQHVFPILLLSICTETLEDRMPVKFQVHQWVVDDVGGDIEASNMTLQ